MKQCLQALRFVENNNISSELLHFYSQNPDLEYVMIDATIVRAHACAAGYGNQDSQGLDRIRGVSQAKYT